MQSLKSFFRKGFCDISEVILMPCLSLSYGKKSFLLILLGVLAYVPFMNPFNANHDEMYSMLLFSYPWKDMIRVIASEDGHPPLYYIVYRLFQMGDDIHNVFALRVATQTFFVLTALLGVFPLRRLIGETASLFFIICVFFLPSSVWLATNIRMYPMAFFVVTGCFVYGELVAQNKRKSNLILFSLFSLCCCYTHYFCAIAAVLIWGILFFRLLMKKQFKKMALLTGIGCIITLLFVPWIVFSFLEQFQNMKTLWFPNQHDIDTAVEGAFFRFTLTGAPFCDILFLFFGIFCWILIWYYLLDCQKDPCRNVVKKAAFVFWGVFLIALVLSLTVRPTLYARLMAVCMGLLSIGVAVALIPYKNFQKIFASLLVISFVPGYMAFYSFVNDPDIKAFVKLFREKIPVTSLIFCTDSNAQIFLKGFLPEYHVVYSPVLPYLILLQDRVLKERAELSDLSDYSELFVFQRSYSVSGGSRYWNDALSEGEPVLKFSENYAGVGYSLGRISLESASSLLKKSEKVLKKSLPHKIDQLSKKNTIN